jgi:hypothetical protein
VVCCLAAENVQLYHGENKLICNVIAMIDVLILLYQHAYLDLYSAVSL